MGKKLQFAFYDVPCEELSKALLGKLLVRKTDKGERLSARIVETEAYLGGDDKAAHSHNGKRTEKTEAMFMPPGTGYVYHIYGIYCCMNISARGEGAAVLIRAVEPVEGIETMRSSRSKGKSSKTPLKDKDIGSGPSKLTQALEISKNDVNKKDLTVCDFLWVEDADEVEVEDMVVSKRVNVDYAGEWAAKPLRFYVRGCSSVSVIDKEAGGDSPTKRKSAAAEKSPEPAKKPRKGDKRLAASYFNKPAAELAQDLLGKLLVRVLDDGTRLSGKIVETQAYPGTEDMASHAYGGKKNNNNTAMYMPAGTTYVYNNYSKFSFNICSKEEAAVVLIRALQPVDGIEAMREVRKKSDDDQLMNGPSNMTEAMQIDKKTGDKQDLSTSDLLWVEDGEAIADGEVVKCPRLNLSKGVGEWADKPLRFYIYRNGCVSAVDKTVESQLAQRKREADAKKGPKKSGAGEKLSVSFFSKSCTDLAKSLLGKVLVRKLESGERLSGKIVETQAFLGKDDKASHSYGGKMNNANQSMYKGPGSIYIFNNFNMYSFNIVSGDAAAVVLIRALEPIDGVDSMRANRKKPLLESLTNGPSCIAEALNLTKVLNKENVVDSGSLWVEDGDSVDDADIVACPRMNLQKTAEEWKDKPLRFYIEGNPCVSSIDKKVEKGKKKKVPTATLR